MKLAGAIFSLVMVLLAVAGAVAFLVYALWMAALSMLVLGGIFGMMVYNDWAGTWKPLFTKK